MEDYKSIEGIIKLYFCRYANPIYFGQKSEGSMKFKNTEDAYL